jgi:hypothetical protein
MSSLSFAIEIRTQLYNKRRREDGRTRYSPASSPDILAQVLQRKEKLGGVESRALLVKLLLALVVEQLAAVDVRRGEVELRLRLEAPFQTDDEW